MRKFDVKPEQQQARRLTHLLIRTALISVALLSLLITSLVNAAQTVLQDINLSSGGNKTLIDIEFGVPLLYVKHFPQKTGEILQIQLKLSDSDDRRIHKEVRQAGDINVPPGLEALLIYVTYEEGVPGGPYLTLRFSESVEFEVRAGTSLQSLVVAVVAEQQVVKEDARRDFAREKKSKKFKKSKKPKKSTKRKRRRPSGLTDSQIDEMMAKARQTLTFGDSKGAIELLRKIIRFPGSRHQQDARELLGLALERSNQIPRAKFEYKKYLRLYSKGDGANRVRQRLTALQNLGIQKKKKLRRTRRGRKDDRLKMFGRWSQSVSSFFVQSDPPDDGSTREPDDFVASRIASSYLNLRGRYRGTKRNVQTVVALNNTYDIQNREKSNSRISYLYVDYDDFSQGLTAVVGRQRVRNGGVFGRFDGVIAGYRLSESIKTHVFFGEPVSFFNSLPYKKSFWGTKIDIGKVKSVLSGNVYFVSQRVNSIQDRKAVGTVLRYSKKGATLFGLVDYDILFKELITSNLRFGWQFTPKSKFNVSYNDRTDLLTSAAIKPYNVTISSVSTPILFDIEKYRSNGLSDEDIFEVAKSAANRTKNYTAGMTYQLDKDRQVNFDVSVFSSSGSERFPTTLANKFTGDEKIALEDVGGTPSSGEQILYSFQWISSNTFVERDLHVVGARYSQTDTTYNASVYFNSRLPPVRNWNPRPSLLISRSKIADKITTVQGVGQLPDVTTVENRGYLTTIKPSIKIDYRWKKAWVFDVAIGIEFLNFSDPGLINSRRQSLRFSYHYTF